MQIPTKPRNATGSNKLFFYFIFVISLGLLALNQVCLAATTDTTAIRFVGNFSTIKTTNARRYGSQVVLWQYKNTVVGIFYNADGQTGDLPRGIIQNVKLNPKSGNLSFEAKLTTGLHSCTEHTNVPSQDLFIFNGVLRKSTLKGRLTQKEALHDTEVFSNAKTTFKHEIQPRFDSYDSLEAWQRYVDTELKQSGPKW
jgi:hypothetical protein